MAKQQSNIANLLERIEGVEKRRLPVRCRTVFLVNLHDALRGTDVRRFMAVVPEWSLEAPVKFVVDGDAIP